MDVTKSNAVPGVRQPELEHVYEAELVEEDGSWYEEAVAAYQQADEEVKDAKWVRAEVSFSIVGKAYQGGDRGLIKQFAGDVRRSARLIYDEAFAHNLKLRLEECGQPQPLTLTPTFYVEAGKGRAREIEAGDKEAIEQAGETLAVAEDEHWTVATLREELQDPSSVHFSSNSPEWYTPEHIIERVEKAMGSIDLDPCADSGRAVPASYHYTKEDDGLTRKWTGRVYMNPSRSGDSCIIEPCNCPCHSGVENAESRSLLPPITSRQTLVIRTDTSPIARTATGRLVEHGKPAVGPMRLNGKDFSQRNAATHNPNADASGSGDNPRSATTVDESGISPLNGGGPPKTGNDASGPSGTNAPTAGPTENLPKTISSPSATPPVPALSSETSSPPVSGATAQSNTEALTSGVPTAHVLNESWTTSQTCRDCEDCIEVFHPVRVFMNPPYGSAIGEWVRKLKEEYERGEVEEAIALVPARTDTEWFGVLRQYPRLFVKGRLKFSQYQNSAPFPSCLFYLGNDGHKFVDAFSGVGDVFGLVNL